MAVSLRGRALKGKSVELPKNVQGFVCRVDDREEDDGKEIVGMQQFNEFTYWNHDALPSGVDAPQRLMKYIQFLDIIHSKNTPLAQSESQPSTQNVSQKP